MAEPTVFEGTVEWTGENPGINLKQHPDGPFVTLASFFRVLFSPHGRGHALVLMQSPQEAKPPSDRPNVCYTDNEPLARYLVGDFLSHFAQYRGLPSPAALVYRGLDSVVSSGDPASTYHETVKAGSDTVQLTWSGLGAPFCFALPPDKSATGCHTMPSVFIGCRDASVTLNGRRLPGQPVPRTIAGRTITTAMLAFSESWIRA
jgi:hypothetical protein